MKGSRLRLAVAAALFVPACSGNPATVKDVTEKMRQEMSDDDYSVSWISVTPQGEAGDFLAIIDRSKAGDPDSEETQICNVNATSNSSSWSCQAAVPSIMTQAAEMLVKDYRSRNIEVQSYALKRSGEGNGFVGEFVLVEPVGGQTVTLPCKGDQKGLDFHIDCDQAFGDDPGRQAPDAGAPGPAT